MFGENQLLTVRAWKHEGGRESLSKSGFAPTDPRVLMVTTDAETVELTQVMLSESGKCGLSFNKEMARASWIHFLE